MRQRKYRAWNKEQEQMLYEGWTETRNGCSIYSSKTSFFMSEGENLIIMDWAGLVDKKEVDIFEGDIIATVRHREKSNQKIEVVIFENGAFCAKCDSDVTIPLLYHNSTEIEVLGNIHQTPELLNQ